MDDLYNKIVRDRGSIENLISRIPGFRGYMEMAGRREADRMVRDYVAGQFEAQLNRLPAIETDMIRGSGIMLMDRTKSLKTRFDTLLRRIQTDTPGYSGFFASNKIGPEELQRVYAFDEAMVEYAASIGSKLDALAQAVTVNEGVEVALSELEAAIQEAHAAYDLRDNVLTGMG